MFRICQSTDELLVALYRAAREQPAQQFQEHALRLIKPWLAAVTRRADPSLISWVSLDRPDPDHHFIDAERTLCQMLMPHLTEALLVNQCIHVGAAYPADGDRAQHLAIADQHGFLCHAAPGFLELLQREWSQADDVRLPTPLIEALVSQTRRTYLGETLSCDGHVAAGMLLLRARTKAPVDVLTPRRSLIARYFAEGHNYKEIARQAQISPATVRNHIRAIYETLGVRTRKELSAMVRGKVASAALS